MPLIPVPVSRKEKDPTAGAAAGVPALHVALQKVLPRFLRALADALLPVRCAACRAFLRSNRDETGYPGSAGNGAGAALAGTCFLTSVVCRHCLNGFVPVESPLCTVCGMPFKSREGDDHVCGECLKGPRHFRRARAAAVYTPMMMALVHAFKYNGRIHLAHPLGVVLAAAYRRFWPEADIDLILPVPLHRGRFRQRGFNQAFLLVKDWAGTDTPSAGSAPTVAIAREAMTRIRPTTPQTGLGRQDRLQNIKKAFRVEKKQVIEERRVLLVDDVYTTGATVDECAKTLLNGGAARVDVLTLVRAL